MGWEKDGELLEGRWLITTMRYPLVFKINEKPHPRCIGMILGDYLGFFNKIENTEITMGEVTREKMVESVDEILKPKEPSFGYFVSCSARQGLLGIKAFDIQEKLKKYLKKVAAK